VPSADLAAWAHARAPGLIARAEAEAVRVLRDALVAGALGERKAPPAPVVHKREDDVGELVWVYCVLAAGNVVPGGLTGVDPAFPVERVEAAGIAALVSRVPRAEFGAEALRQNLNELAWLERVARAHEELLENALEHATLVPLRLCTLYESEDGVRRMLDQERENLVVALDALVGREEWGLKLLADPQGLADEVRATDPDAMAMAAELDSQSEGGAYMLRRRLERHLHAGADALATEIASDLRARLERSEVEFVTRPPQNRELSRHQGEMLVNAACLVDVAGLERLRVLAADFESRYRELGARLELTGPWPPYNFAVGGDPATFA
jgi:Gas vesicle synthesis protein GvpL/GvpF